MLSLADSRRKCKLSPECEIDGDRSAGESSLTDPFEPPPTLFILPSCTRRACAGFIIAFFSSAVGEYGCTGDVDVKDVEGP